MRHIVNLEKIAGIILMIIVTGCSGKNDASQNGSAGGTTVQSKAALKPSGNKPNNTSSATGAYTCEECVSLVDKIVRSSNYDIDFKRKYDVDYLVIIDEATKEKVVIQIALKGTDGNVASIGWLELKIKEKIMQDITADSEEPVNLNVPVSTIENFTTKCLQCCLD